MTRSLPASGPHHPGTSASDARRGSRHGRAPRVAVAAAGLLAALLLATGFRPAAAQSAKSRPGDHTIQIAGEDLATVGDARALALSIEPGAGFAISQDGPLTIDLDVTPEPGLGLPRHRYERRHAVDGNTAALRFDLLYRAERAGRYTVTVRLRFWLCSKRTCRPVQARRRVHIVVSEAGPSARLAPLATPAASPAAPAALVSRAGP